MKIAIISLPLSYNYGGYLQCYALMETLRQLGNEVYYLQRENGKQSSLKKILDSFKKMCEYIGLGEVIYIFEQQTNFIENQLNTFKAISVREKDGIKLLEENVKLNITPNVVLDPTLLLSKEHYLNIAQQIPKRNGVLTYILNNNEEKAQIIKEFCQKRKLQSYSVINPKTNSNIIKGSQGYPIEDWIAGFRDANFVMTDSFHAIVFSIIFNKPFWVFENEARGNSRLKNILQLFECNDRFISTQENLNIVDWERPIDWNRINHIKDLLTKKSLDFLKDALEND